MPSFLWRAPAPYFPAKHSTTRRFTVRMMLFRLKAPSPPPSTFNPEHYGHTVQISRCMCWSVCGFSFAGRYCWFGKGEWENRGDRVGRSEHGLIHAGWRIDRVRNGHWWWRFLQVRYEYHYTVWQTIYIISVIINKQITNLLWSLERHFLIESL